MYDAYPTHEDAASDILSIKTANDWASAAWERAPRAMLFDEYWLEGELAVLFGDAGKSSLAVQIGESIARGAAIGPLRMTAEAGPVLYVDLGQTGTQFGMRYAAEEGREDAGEAGGYQFSDGLHRAELRPDAMISGPKGTRAFLGSIERKLVEVGARVLIIDSITHLRRSNYGTEGDILLMRGLNRLKRLMHLSILVVANADRRDTTHELTIHDLGPSRILGNFADSVFAVGQCGRRGPFRYLKHVRGYRSDAVYDEEHTPAFRLGRLETGLFGLDFDSFGPEVRHIYRPYLADSREAMTEAARLAAEGHSVREIAAELDISKTKAHRLLQMSTREDLMSKPAEDERAVDGWRPEWFPGEEKYDEALADPRFERMFSSDDDAALELRRESYLIDAAKAAARTEYTENGVETTYEEMIAKVSCGGKPAETESVAVSEGKGAERELKETFSDPGPEVSSGRPVTRPPAIGSGLKRELDGYGRVIWVENEDERGRRTVWYSRNKQGIVKRWERTFEGFFGKIVTDNETLAKVREAERYDE